jgi:hypothetical protein
MLSGTSEHLKCILEIVLLARKMNPEIGFYKRHFINSQYEYVIRVSNGFLRVSVTKVEFLDHWNSVSPDKILALVNTFTKCNRVYFFLKIFL